VLRGPVLIYLLAITSLALVYTLASGIPERDKFFSDKLPKNPIKEINSSNFSKLPH